MTKSLTATFRIVTPMFLGGAEPSKEAELRVPSIKGALRFWWRALQWGKVTNIAELWKREAALFGSSDSETGQSKFLMRLEISNSAKVIKSGENLSLRGNKADSQEVVGDGARYLGYGLMEAFNGQNTRAGRLTRSCLASPFEFNLHLRFKPTTCATLQAEVIRALKLLGLCGGLGSRVRRGYGSLSLVSLQQGGEVIWSAPKNADEWAKELTTVVSELPESKEAPEWTAFSQGHSKVLLLPSPPTSPLELLARMGRDFVFFRSWGRDGMVLNVVSEKLFKDDHDLMKASVNNRTQHPRRIAFGLPHNYGKKPEEQVEPIDSEFDRRASSLFFHIHQPTEEQNPLGVLLFLPSRFLPKGRDKISVGGKSVPLAHGGTGDFWNPVHAFLDRMHSVKSRETFTGKQLIRL